MSELTGSCLMSSRASTLSSLCSKVNLSKFSLSSTLGSLRASPSSVGGRLYSNITLLEMTNPSHATWSVARPTSCAKGKNRTHVCIHKRTQIFNSSIFTFLGMVYEWNTHQRKLVIFTRWERVYVMCDVYGDIWRAETLRPISFKFGINHPPSSATFLVL